MHRVIFRILQALILLPIALWTCSFGLFSRRGRNAASQLLRQYKLSLGLTETKIMLPKMQWVNCLAKSPIVLTELGGISGNVTLHELVAIASIIRATKPMRVFEFGTFDGRTTLNMALNSPDGSEVLTLDLPKEHVDQTALSICDSELKWIKKFSIGERFLGVSLGKRRITQLYGDSATFDYSPFKENCDVIFVDASHSYDYVLNDTEMAFALLKKNGVVIWHDYGVWPGVTEALDQIFRGGSHPAGHLCQIAGTSLVVLCSGDFS